jgi:hypothetical protein
VYRTHLPRQRLTDTARCARPDTTGESNRHHPLRTRAKWLSAREHAGGGAGPSSSAASALSAFANYVAPIRNRSRSNGSPQTSDTTTIRCPPTAPPHPSPLTPTPTHTPTLTHTHTHTRHVFSTRA